MPLSAITVSPGIDLTYTDTSAPEASPYKTIFAIHGMCCTNLIFKRLQAAAIAKGFRLVAVNRRGFGGSTPYSAEEINVIVNVETSAEKRATFMEARGHEFACFIDVFTQKFGLPPVSDAGRTGGSIVFGWSIGSPFAAATLAYAPTLPFDVRSRLASHIRALVVYGALLQVSFPDYLLELKFTDPAPKTFGLPTPEKNWSPLADTTIPKEARLPMFAQWVTGYFDHGDYSKRDLDTLSYVLPSTDRVPSAFNIPSEEMNNVGPGADFDGPLLFFFEEQLKTTFRRAFNRSETTALFPKLKITFICADRSPPFALAALWAVQDDLKEIGMGDNIDYKIVTGANHYLHWEEPEKALELITAKA